MMLGGAGAARRLGSFDQDRAFAVFLGGEAGEDAGEVAADIGGCVDHASASGLVQIEPALHPHTGTAMQAFDGQHRQHESVFQFLGRDRLVKTVLVGVVSHG